MYKVPDINRLISEKCRNASRYNCWKGTICIKYRSSQKRINSKTKILILKGFSRQKKSRGRAEISGQTKWRII